MLDCSSDIVILTIMLIAIVFITAAIIVLISFCREIVCKQSIINNDIEKPRKIIIYSGVILFSVTIYGLIWHCIYLSDCNKHTIYDTIDNFNYVIPSFHKSRLNIYASNK